MAIEVPERPLEAGEFILRAWRPKEAAWYLSARDEDVFAWTTEARSATRDELAATISENNARPKWVALAICRGDGTPIGNISLVPAVGQSGWAEISYWLAPSGRRRGAATRAVGALVDWALAEGDFDGVFLKIAPRNAASIAVAVRCGFREVGREGDAIRFEKRK